MKTPKQSSKNKTLKKILLICGIIVGIILLLVAGILLYTTHAIRKFKKEYTEDKPAVIKHEPITKKQQTQLATKYNTLKEALKTHKRTEIQLTSDEFSQMLAYSPETKRFANQSRFWLDGDKIKADLSLSLNTIPQMQGRYLNGIFTFSVVVQNNRIHFRVDECVAKGQPIAPTFIKLLNSMNFDDQIMQRTEKNWRDFIESMEIKDSKITFKTH